MIKYKMYIWLIQSVVIAIVLTIYWGGIYGLLISFAGIILIPFSLLSDYVTRSLSLGYRLISSFTILIGASVVFFLASQGWMLSILYGLTYWAVDTIFKLSDSSRR